MKTISKNGLIVDFAAFIAKSGSTVAVGNAKMNARGDVLSHGGLVNKSAEEAANDYYKNNPRAVSHTVGLGSIEDEILPSPADAMKQLEALGLEIGKKPRRKTTDE